MSDILPNGDREFIGLSSKKDSNIKNFYILIENNKFLGTPMTKTFVETVRKTWQKELLQDADDIIKIIDKNLDEECQG